MPKKRHNNKYSKPPSVAPPSLALSSSRTTEQHERSVNQLLADMRRSSLNQNGVQNNLVAATPTVPPSIRQILQIPETPAPMPRRPPRRDANGRRAPPGPPPPRSWVSLALSRHAPKELKSEVGGHISHLPLPDAYIPNAGSFIDQLLRRMAQDWEQQRHCNQFYTYTLPSHLRTSLLTYVTEFYEPGLSIKDLRLVLAGPSDEIFAEYDVDKPELDTLNGDVFYLDLAGSVGKSVTLKELNDLLFPPKVAIEQSNLQDSWDSPEPISGPVRMLPNLTRLSLAIDTYNAPNVSWKQLLSLASNLPTLTHLNISGWPEPSLTPNAKLARVISPVTGRSVQYSGTGPYSHNLDDDWSEAILILKRLSKALYSLEYLDLTGCGDWFPALMKESDGDFTTDYVDWVGDWGKITTLRLYSGYALTDHSNMGQISLFAEWIESGTAVEKHVRAQRAGRGRWITVDKDTLPEEAEAIIATQRLKYSLWSRHT
ncbi:hypothetical protein F4781DRAFT_202435 [Annulohypoxylon bovei var. microspora]|nr:hypothetical protein F4781DRAFT_202435 [Annulohypoxylon bovei var. microspora]